MPLRLSTRQLSDAKRKSYARSATCWFWTWVSELARLKFMCGCSHCRRAPNQRHAVHDQQHGRLGEGCDHHPLAREDLAFALSVVLLGLLVMVTRISQATAGGMGISCVSTPRPTAQASRRLASKHLCGRTIFRHHPWCKPSPSILVLAAVSVLAPVQNGLAETASADGAISTQRRRSAHRDATLSPCDT